MELNEIENTNNTTAGNCRTVPDNEFENVPKSNGINMEDEDNEDIDIIVKDEVPILINDGVLDTKQNNHDSDNNGNQSEDENEVKKRKNVKENDYLKATPPKKRKRVEENEDLQQENKDFQQENEELEVTSALSSRPKRNSNLRNKKTFTCEKCDYVTFSEDDYNNHCLIDHYEPTVPKKKNKKKPKSYDDSDDNESPQPKKGRGRPKKNVSKKSKKYRDDDEFCCSKCNYVTTFEADLDSHNIIEHSGPKRHQCPNCTFSYTRKMDLDKHIDSVHTEGQNSDSQGSDYEPTETTLNLKPRKLAKRTRKGSDDSDSEYKEQKCPDCRFKCDSSQELERHMKSSHGTYLYNCDKCQFKAKNKQILSYHQNRVHSMIHNFLCNKCLYATVRFKKLVKHHKQAHAKKTELDCETCGYKAVSIEKLTMHIGKKHAVNKRYQCNICDASYERVRSLNRHMRQKHKGKDKGEEKGDLEGEEDQEDLQEEHFEDEANVEGNEEDQEENNEDNEHDNEDNEDINEQQTYIDPSQYVENVINEDLVPTTGVGYYEEEDSESE